MWIIDKDLIFDGEAKGTTSRDFKEGTLLPHRFSMFDDDDNCMYQGRTDKDSSFAPLDDFGKPNVGCTWMTIDGEQL